MPVEAHKSEPLFTSHNWMSFEKLAAVILVPIRAECKLPDGRLKWAQNH